MTCRCCLSQQIQELEIRRSFYLSNLDHIQKVSYSICESCGFIFQRDYVGDEFLTKYYASSPMLRRSEPTAYEIDQNYRQAEFVTRNIDISKTRALEIGAHSGAFLEHLRDKYDCDCDYHELSIEASELLSSKGFNEFHYSADQVYDLIILRHVVEHIFDLDSFLKQLHNHLKPDGHIFIEVPDWTIYDDSVDPLIFEHINQFHSNSLLKLLIRNNYCIDSYEKSIHPDDPASPNRVQRILVHSDSVSSQSRLYSDVFNDFTGTAYDSWKEDLNTLLTQHIGDKTIALYPASHLSFDALADTNLSDANVIGFFDIDPKKEGKTFLNINVFNPQALKSYNPEYILIFTMAYEPEIRQSFVDMNLSSNVISITQLVKKSVPELS